MEVIVRPRAWDHWDKMGMYPFSRALRFEMGEAMVLQDHFFLQRILPGAVLRTLSVKEIAEYRRPTLTWPREIPIEGEPGVRLHGRRSIGSRTEPTSF
jgi:haloalkane dehalogenase